MRRRSGNPRIRSRQFVLVRSGRLVATAILAGLVASLPHERFYWAVAAMAKSRSGIAVHWSRPIVSLTMVKPSRQSGVAESALRDVLLSGIAAWNHATRDCKVPRLVLNDVPEKHNWLAQDGRSLVMVQSQVECNTAENTSPLCMEKDVAARTHFYPHYTLQRRDDGLVEEADIELNAVAYQWILDAPRDENASLRRTIHHELGHVLGLDHPCEMSVMASARHSPALPICQDSETELLLMHPSASVTDRAVSLNPSPADVAELCREYGWESWPKRLLSGASFSRLAIFFLASAGVLLALLVRARRRPARIH